MSNKMKGYVKINNEKYYKVVADEGKYMLFESKGKFKKLQELERMIYDLVRFAVSRKDTKEIILSRMNEIEKYLESLKSEEKIRIKVIDENLDVDEDGENLLAMKMHLMSSFPIWNIIFIQFILMKDGILKCFIEN